MIRFDFDSDAVRYVSQGPVTTALLLEMSRVAHELAERLGTTCAHGPSVRRRDDGEYHYEYEFEESHEYSDLVETLYDEYWQRYSNGFTLQLEVDPKEYRYCIVCHGDGDIMFELVTQDVWDTLPTQCTPEEWDARPPLPEDARVKRFVDVSEFFQYIAMHGIQIDDACEDKIT